MTDCPCCGQVLPERDKIFVDLATNTAVIDGRFVRLKPKPAEILFVLNEIAPRIATRGFLMRRLYGLGESPESDSILCVYIHRLREALYRTSVGIEGVHCGGWRLYRKPHPVVDLGTNTVMIGGQIVDLSFTQAQILDLLSGSMSEIVDKDRVWRAGWGDGKPTKHCVSKQIRQIRKKIGHFGFNLETVYAAGYRLEHDDRKRKLHLVDKQRNLRVSGRSVFHNRAAVTDARPGAVAA